jgi:hypothetical protein
MPLSGEERWSRRIYGKRVAQIAHTAKALQKTFKEVKIHKRRSFKIEDILLAMQQEQKTGMICWI